MSRNASELVSMPVVNTIIGRRLGRVKDAIFDPELHELFGLVVDDDTEGNKFLSRHAIRGLGTDAVTVEGSGAIAPITSEPRAVELMESGIHLRGSKVLTEDGDSLGTLDKIIIEDDGKVDFYEASSGIFGLGERHEILPEQVIKIGTDAIIVAADVMGGTQTAAPDSQPGVIEDERQ